MREASVVACPYLEVFVDRVLVVEFHLGVAVADVHGKVLHGLAPVGSFCSEIFVSIVIVVVIIHVPAACRQSQVKEVAVGEVVAVRQLAVHHAHVAVGTGVACHDARVALSDDTIMIRRMAIVLMPPEHEHAAGTEVVLLRQVEGQSGTGEEVVTILAVLALVGLILVSLQILLFAQTSALVVLAVAIADIGVSIEEARRIVDVGTGVGAAVAVGTGLQRSIVASAAVAFQHDVDDACRPFGRELCRGVVDHLDALDALCRQLLQYLSAVVGGQSAGLAVDPHLHAGVATQRDIAVLVYLDARDVFQHIAGRAAGIRDVGRHIERLAVHLELHRRPLPRHGHFLEHGGILREIEHVVVDIWFLLGDAEFSGDGLVAYERHLQLVVADGETTNVEMSTLISNGTLQNLRGVALLIDGYIDKLQAFAVTLVRYMTSHTALRKGYHAAHREQACQ